MTRNEIREPLIEYRVIKNLRWRTVQKMQAGITIEEKTVFAFSFRVAKAPVIRYLSRLAIRSQKADEFLVCFFAPR